MDYNPKLYREDLTTEDNERFQSRAILTKCGHLIRVFSSLYVDWGLEIREDGGSGVSVYYSPSALSTESYGVHWEDEEGNPLDEGTPWTLQEWRDCLEDEADSFLEAYVGD